MVMKKITWVIKDFSSLQYSVCSDQFFVGGCRWFLRASVRDDNFSLYLEVASRLYLSLHPMFEGWRRHAKCFITLVNQVSEKLSLLKAADKWFDQTTLECGFPEMITLTELNAKNGFLVNGELKVVAEIVVLEVVGVIDVSTDTSPVLESIDIYGFQVLPSQVESMKRLFERDLDIASKLRPKNPYLKTAYMNVLLSLTQMLCQLPQELSTDDISGACASLTCLKDAGFKLDWLQKKLDELKEKKQKEAACLAQLKEMDDLLQPFKKKCLNIEAQINKKKQELLAARAPLYLYDDNAV